MAGTHASSVRIRHLHLCVTFSPFFPVSKEQISWLLWKGDVALPLIWWISTPPLTSSFPSLTSTSHPKAWLDPTASPFPSLSVPQSFGEGGPAPAVPAFHLVLTQPLHPLLLATPLSPEFPSAGFRSAQTKET